MSFDPNYRKSTLMQYASNYGMKDARNLDDIFNISLDQGRIYVNPKINILNLNASAVRTLRNELIPDFQFPKKPKTEQFTQFILVSDDFYSDKINFVWMKAPLTKAGAIKSPITSVDILEEMKGALDPVRMPFYLALLQGQVHENIPDLSEQLAQVRELIKNPLNLPFYFNQNDRYSNSKITSKSIKPIEIKRVDSSACIHVKQQNDYYVLTCRVILENKDFD